MASWIQSAFGSKVSPVILFIIVLLAAVFFIAAVIYLLVRFLLKQRSTSSSHFQDLSTSGPLQRQLQHLFHLHDSGLDQAYIDALPVFLYKDIVGKKEPFDCAVCLSEFSEQDRLRLLPLCSHAFHIHCIDTWLLSNSSCPLCRGVILSNVYESPVFAFDDLKENIVGGSSRNYDNVVLKGVENDDNGSAAINGKRVFSVRLGKFKSTKNGNNDDNNCVRSEERESEVVESSGNSSLDGRRCFSMGSYQYVVADSELQVALCPGGGVEGSGELRPVKRKWGQNGNLASEGQNGNYACDGNIGGVPDGKRINRGIKGESFSVSKIWLWSKKGKFPSSTSTNYGNSISNEVFP